MFMLRFANVLSDDQLSEIRSNLLDGSWTDGKLTAGGAAAEVKNNTQADKTDQKVQQAAQTLRQILAADQQLCNSVMIRRMTPILFNRHEAGNGYGNHLDTPIRYIRGEPMRCDLSATLFLNDPTSYDGGELVIETMAEPHRIKMKAGSMVVYPASYLHRVEPVTNGTRLAAVVWIESLISDPEKLGILMEIRQTIRAMKDKTLQLRMNKVLNSLIRQWSST